MSSPLIFVDELAAAVGTGASPTVLDVRWRLGGPPGREEFDRGHVPGSVHVDLDSALAAPAGPRGRHPLPPVEVFEAAMRAAGVSGDRPVVVLDDWAGRAAARAWWLLRFHGHPDVRVLDGGWSAWLASGEAVETGPGDVAPGDFSARPGGMPVVEVDGVLDVGVLVDARDPERYRGEVEPVDPVAGHVPGAVNVPTSINVRADGRFRDPVQLRALYAAEGVTPDADVAAYCGSGVTAAHDVLAMEVAGIRAALWPGSWSEWVADRSRPVATTAD
ncbi:sulfurtransferase [Nocardioides deserti]|uniref:sulfurtransferase n=1 Tax=Nocardioides deserti TaxID=1588644 RepID=UPI0019AE430C|nr:sulfurtransferase [Nocardioides deserti]GGO69283.1 sulfurtransferase [Nocardioides deserti]